MKRVIKIVSILIIAVSLIIIAHLSTATAQEGSFTMPWSAISAGGGGGSSGDFAFITTLGQPIAGRVSNGPFSLTSGFLGLLEPGLVSYKLFVPLIAH